jgi:hypothetical protein
MAVMMTRMMTMVVVMVVVRRRRRRRRRRAADCGLRVTRPMPATVVGRYLQGG